jgi:hypothetical protein
VQEPPQRRADQARITPPALTKVPEQRMNGGFTMSRTPLLGKEAQRLCIFEEGSDD